MRYVREDRVPPRARHRANQRVPAETALGRTASVETTGGTADAEPTGDSRSARAGRKQGGGR